MPQIQRYVKCTYIRDKSHASLIQVMLSPFPYQNVTLPLALFNNIEILAVQQLTIKYEGS